jgi:hypothetical protein
MAKMRGLIPARMERLDINYPLDLITAVRSVAELFWERWRIDLFSDLVFRAREGYAYEY